MARWLLPAAVLVGVAGMAVSLATGALGLLATLVAIPLAAATRLSGRATALTAAAIVAVAIVAGVPHDAFDEAHVGALLALLLAGLLAVVIAARLRRLERSAAFATFLADASTLLSCSLDLESTAAAAAAVPVPELADWCRVEVRRPGGEVELRASSHPDPASEELADALVAAAVDPPGRAERAKLWNDVGGHGPRSALLVPLRTPEGSLGSMLMVAGRRLEAADLERAEELAGRCALALDNTRAYREAAGGPRRFGRVDAPRSARPAD